MYARADCFYFPFVQQMKFYSINTRVFVSEDVVTREHETYRISSTLFFAAICFLHLKQLSLFVPLSSYDKSNDIHELH